VESLERIDNPFYGFLSIQPGEHDMKWKPFAAGFFAAFCVAGLASRSSLADEPTGENDVRRVVALIDGHLDSRWREENILPTERVDDAGYLRRASLDVNGCIPAVADVRAFLDDSSPDKREQLIDRLLDDPRYTVHFTNFWRNVLIPEAESDLNFMYLTPGFEAWLRTRLLDNTSYQEMVREILDVDVTGQNMYGYSDVSPLAFYASKEIKPENLAAATSRMFLGVRIECAQCHDHPFDDWTRQDFWGYAAFFAGLERQRPGAGSQGLLAGLREFFGQSKIKIPDTDQYVEPTYLTGEGMSRGTALRPRQALADWIIADDNPYFARMVVNRMWGHFFGVGFVEPVDDFSELNPPSHPDLLDTLAEEFVAHDYDLKFLIRAITLSQAYQLSSRQTDPTQTEPQRFAKMTMKGLTPEQVYDSLQQATGGFDPFAAQSQVYFFQDSPRSRIDELFSDQGTTPTGRPTSILQSLAIMNGDLVAQATSLDQSQLLRSVVDFPGFDTGSRIETIFLAVLTRSPTQEERQRLVAYVEDGGPQNDSQQALADVFWALLNSSEFLFNH
jgi:hypothetical protein